MSAMIACPRGSHCLSGAARHRSGSKQLELCRSTPLTASDRVSLSTVKNEFNSSVEESSSPFDDLLYRVDQISVDMTKEEMKETNDYLDALYKVGVINDQECAKAHLYSYRLDHDDVDDCVNILLDAEQRMQDKNYRVPSPGGEDVPLDELDPRYVMKLNEVVSPLVEEMEIRSFHFKGDDIDYDTDEGGDDDDLDDVLSADDLDDEWSIVGAITQSGADKVMGMSVNRDNDYPVLTRADGSTLIFFTSFINGPDAVSNVYGEWNSPDNSDYGDVVWGPIRGDSHRMEEVAEDILYWAAGGVKMPRERNIG